MRKIIAFVAALVFGTAFFASCSDDNKSSEASSDCAINSVVMGTLNRVYTTYLNGKDTSYNVTVTGSLYPLHIDQLRGMVFNSDSLPQGTDITKVALTTFSADGVVGYRLESGKDTLFSTSDSIDFTNPRLFTIYSADGSGKRSYTINIVVHNSDPEAFSWAQAAPVNADVAALEEMRILANDGTLYLWGKKGGKTVVLTRSAEGKADWTANEVSGVENLESKSVNLFDGKFVAIADGGFATSTDGKAWTIQKSAITPDRILAVSDRDVYVVAENKVYSSSDGTNWKEEAIDDDASTLPAEFVSSAVIPAANNAQIENIISLGYTDGKDEVWKKIEDTIYPEEDSWYHYLYNEDTPRTLPYLKGFNLVKYDGNLLAVGVANDTVRMYSSTDMARTWNHVTIKTTLPANIGTPAEVGAASDKDNNIWLVCSGTGVLWKGYLNRLKAVENK